MAPLFLLNPADPFPLYAQLETAIKLAVVSGKLKLGDQLPTVRQLAVDLNINANTVARVYAELERQGVLATRRGVGTFVDSPPSAPQLPPAKRLLQLRSLAQRCLADALAHGFSPDELLVELNSLTASKQPASSKKEKSHGQR